MTKTEMQKLVDMYKESVKNAERWSKEKEKASRENNDKAWIDAQYEYTQAAAEKRALFRILNTVCGLNYLEIKDLANGVAVLA